MSSSTASDGPARETADTEWLPSTFISGPKHLPIAYTADA